MGILDTLLKNPDMLSDVARLASENPQITKAVMGLFSSRDTSVGDDQGLGGILANLESGGLGDIVSSWLGDGDNKAVEPHQIEKSLGHEKLSGFADKAGIGLGEAAGLLAGVLPSIVDKLSPEGNLPEQDGFDDVLAGLFGSGLKA